MKRVICAGSLHYDIMVEAPHRPEKGETVQGYRWYPKFGGKGGNQALGAANAGCKVAMVSAVGNDSFATALLGVLEAHQIDISHVQRISTAGSGMSVATMDDEGDYGAVIVSGANLEIDNSLLADDTLWQDAGMLILQNEVREQTNLAAAREAHKRGIPVCINAAPARPLPDDLIKLIDVLVVNEIEARDLGGGEVHDLDSAAAAARTLAAQYRQVVVTAGGAGVAYAGQDGTSGKLPAIKVKLISTHGAGDCFVGNLCAKIMAGASLEEAVTFANQQAAIHVSTVHQDIAL